MIFYYLDDMLIPATNENEILQRIEHVLKIFHEVKLIRHSKKCLFRTNRIGFELHNGILK